MLEKASELSELTDLAVSEADSRSVRAVGT